MNQEIKIPKIQYQELGIHVFCINFLLLRADPEVRLGYGALSPKARNKTKGFGHFSTLSSPKDLIESQWTVI